jgi:L-ascorbate metabolism protein UlaG (beta-lactamase superfamily)
MDPWLVGDLTFLDAAWLYRGRKRGLPLPVDLDAVCGRTDVILLSQALPDHAHAPTLAALPDKALPVICSPAAEAAARAAGFTNVTPLPHGASVTTAGGRLRVTATAGALVGPPWSQRENGFVIEQTGDASAGGTPPLRLYYEPHCDAGPGALDGLAPVDVVITPAVSQKIAGFPLVMGDENAVGLCGALRPAALVPLVNAEFTQEGPLAAVIQEVGKGPVDLQARLRGAGLGTRVVAPGKPGEAVVVEV